jgi:hypothetical protein
MNEQVSGPTGRVKSEHSLQVSRMVLVVSTMLAIFQLPARAHGGCEHSKTSTDNHDSLTSALEVLRRGRDDDVDFHVGGAALCGYLENELYLDRHHTWSRGGDTGAPALLCGAHTS